MSGIIKDFKMPNEIKGKKISLRHVNEDDTKTVKNICDALFCGQTMERIKKTMGYFSDGPEDIPSLIKSLNQCFKKNGFNYFIFRENEVIGQIYGFPLGGHNKDAVSIWGWISDKALRQGYMKETIKMMEDEHFFKSSDALEIFVRVNPVIESFCKAVRFHTQEKGDIRSYFRHRDEWLQEKQPRIILHHDNKQNIAQNTREN